MRHLPRRIRNLFTWRNLKRASGKTHLFIHRNSMELSLLMLALLMVISVLGFQNQSEKRSEEFDQQAKKLEKRIQELKREQRQTRIDLIDDHTKDSEEFHRKQNQFMKCLMTVHSVENPRQHIAKCDRRFNPENTLQSSSANADSGNGSGTAQQSSATQQSQQSGSQAADNGQGNNQGNGVDFAPGLINVCQRR